jgi:hypothetical protein
VIAGTEGNVPETGAAKRRKAKKPENPERKRKPEGEGKAGGGERKNPALSRRRKIFSVIQR